MHLAITDKMTKLVDLIHAVEFDRGYHMPQCDCLLCKMILV